jgi:MoxR-like ATPase
MNFEKPQSNEVIKQIKFTPQYNRKGEIIGYYKDSPGLKRISLDLDSGVNPNTDTYYDVEIIEDTNPDNPNKGQIIVKIIGKTGGEIVLTEEQKQRYSEMDRELDESEPLSRRLNQINSTAVNREKLRELVQQLEKQKTKNKRFAKLAEGRVYPEDQVENVFESRKNELQKQLNETFSVDENGKPEVGRESEYSMMKNLLDLRIKNFEKAFINIKFLENEIAIKKEAKKKIREQLFKKTWAVKDREYKNKQIISLEEMEYVNMVSKTIDRLKSELEQQALTDPEAWYTYHTLKLRKLWNQNKEGNIMETPSLEKKAEKLADMLAMGNPVFIHGHLGSGKTELARYISKNVLGKNYHIISGSRHMSASEIYGSDVLTVNNERKEGKTIDVQAEEELNAWLNENEERLSKLSENQKEGEINRAQQRILSSLSQSATISDFVPGPIYRAMENGEPFIIDEINAIPHEILIGLNDLLTRKVGDKVKIQQDGGREITVKEGFCVIMTGNLNNGDLNQYVDRKELDPAFVSRIHSEEHDYLPQATEGGLEEASVNHDELFLLSTTLLLDRQANLKIPEDSLKKLWNLSRAAKILQNVFANKQVESTYYYDISGPTGRVKPKLKTAVLSLRAIKNILESWQKDNYNKELDYYVYTYFVESITEPNDKAYVYQLLTKMAFFSSDNWKRSNYGDGGQLSSFSVEVPENKTKGEPVLMSPRHVVDTLYGKENKPERVIWPIVPIMENKKTNPVEGEITVEEEISALDRRKLDEIAKEAGSFFGDDEFEDDLEQRIQEEEIETK